MHLRQALAGRGYRNTHNYAQTVVRTPKQPTTKEVFLATMEELFGPSHPISLIRIEQGKHAEKIVYHIDLGDFDGRKDPISAEEHTKYSWRIQTYFWLKDGPTRLVDWATREQAGELAVA